MPSEVQHQFCASDLEVSFKTYEGIKPVLAIEQLDVHRGETFGLVGESGSGKSVFALAILRLLATPPAVLGNHSRIVLDGEDLLAKTTKEMRQIRGRKVAMIFQDPMSTLNPVFTVGKQLERIIRRIDGLRGEAARARALEILQLVELPDTESLLGKYPHQLSGGQRQRVIIAFALACRAEFIIADEPTRNLDVTIQAGVLKLLARLQRELGVTVLFIANNLGLVSVFCDRVAVLMHGSVVEAGSVGEVVRRTAHPYTLMLRRTVETVRESEATAGVPTEGETSGDATDKVNGCGCSYFRQCAHRLSICGSSVPTLVNVGGTHLVACHAVGREGLA